MTAESKTVLIVDEDPDVRQFVRSVLEQDGYGFIEAINGQVAYEKAKEDAQGRGSLPVPLHIRNAPTRLMGELGYGKDYQYAHDFEHGYVAQEYLPDALKGRKYYEPTEHGHEKWIKERMAWLEKLKAQGWKKGKQGKKAKE